MKISQLLEQVEADARELRPHLVVLTAVAAILFAIGWLIGMLVRAVWLVVAWSIAAAKVGFKSGRGKRRGA